MKRKGKEGEGDNIHSYLRCQPRDHLEEGKKGRKEEGERWNMGSTPARPLGGSEISKGERRKEERKRKEKWTPLCPSRNTSKPR